MREDSCRNCYLWRAWQHTHCRMPNTADNLADGDLNCRTRKAFVPRRSEQSKQCRSPPAGCWGGSGAAAAAPGALPSSRGQDRVTEAGQVGICWNAMPRDSDDAYFYLLFHTSSTFSSNFRASRFSPAFPNAPSHRYWQEKPPAERCGYDCRWTGPNAPGPVPRCPLRRRSGRAPHQYGGCPSTTRSRHALPSEQGAEVTRRRAPGETGGGRRWRGDEQPPAGDPGAAEAPPAALGSAGRGGRGPRRVGAPSSGVGFGSGRTGPG